METSIETTIKSESDYLIDRMNYLGFVPEVFTENQEVKYLWRELLDINPEVAKHAWRVTALTQIFFSIIKKNGVNTGIHFKEFIDAALVHDIGKKVSFIKSGLAMEIPDELPDEIKYLHPLEPDTTPLSTISDNLAHRANKNHPYVGAAILCETNLSDDSIETVLQHHECGPNGKSHKGYPQGLLLDEIRVSAHILKLCDEIDAAIRFRDSPRKTIKTLSAIVDEINSGFIHGGKYKPELYSPFKDYATWLLSPPGRSFVNKLFKITDIDYMREDY